MSILNFFRSKPIWIKYINPDGTLGGDVASDAIIHKSVIVEAGALVAPRVTLYENDRVLSGELVIDSNVRIRID